MHKNSNRIHCSATTVNIQQCLEEILVWCFVLESNQPHKCRYLLKNVFFVCGEKKTSLSNDKLVDVWKHGGPLRQLVCSGGQQLP